VLLRPSPADGFVHFDIITHSGTRRAH